MREISDTLTFLEISWMKKKSSRNGRVQRVSSWVAEGFIKRVGKERVIEFPPEWQNSLLNAREMRESWSILRVAEGFIKRDGNARVMKHPPEWQKALLNAWENAQFVTPVRAGKCWWIF